MSGLLASILIKVGHTVQCPCCPALIDSVRNSEIQIGAEIRNIFGTVHIFPIMGQNYLPKVFASAVFLFKSVNLSNCDRVLREYIHKYKQKNN